jgi:hypothetical protein
MRAENATEENPRPSPRVYAYSHAQVQELQVGALHEHAGAQDVDAAPGPAERGSRVCASRTYLAICRKRKLELYRFAASLNLKAQTKILDEP